MMPTEPLAERLASVAARYLELERIMLRGEFMTSAEMKEFAALWLWRQCERELVAVGWCDRRLFEASTSKTTRGQEK